MKDAGLTVLLGMCETNETDEGGRGKRIRTRPIYQVQNDDQTSGNDADFSSDDDIRDKTYTAKKGDVKSAYDSDYSDSDHLPTPTKGKGQNQSKRGIQITPTKPKDVKKRCGGRRPTHEAPTVLAKRPLDLGDIPKPTSDKGILKGNTNPRLL